MTGSSTPDGCDLYYEEQGEGIPILLIHPAGSTASTWGSATAQLARVGRVITYDRRGYARTGGEPVHSVFEHTADAAGLLEHLGTAPAVAVGTSAGAAIAVDLAVRRPDLVRVVIAHEFPWRFTRQLPTASQVTALATIGSLALRGRHSDAAEALLRAAYAYRDGGSAWDAFPAEWRRAGRENARAALADFRNSIREYPSRADLATVETPVVCTYGERSPRWMLALVRRLTATIPTGRTRQIPGSGHAAPFDATASFVQLIAESIRPAATPERGASPASGRVWIGRPGSRNQGADQAARPMSAQARASTLRRTSRTSERSSRDRDIRVSKGKVREGHVGDQSHHATGASADGSSAEDASSARPGC